MIQLFGDHVNLTDDILNLLIQGVEYLQCIAQLLILLVDLADYAIHNLYALVGIADQVLHDAADLVCGFLGLVCQTTNLFRYDCEASAHLTGSRCLNAGI